MITLDSDGRVDAGAVNFILNKKRRYEWIQGMKGAVLRQIIFMDWLLLNPRKGPELTEAYNWLENQSVIKNAAYYFAELLGE